MKLPKVLSLAFLLMLCLIGTTLASTTATSLAISRLLRVNHSIRAIKLLLVNNGHYVHSDDAVRPAF